MRWVKCKDCKKKRNWGLVGKSRVHFPPNTEIGVVVCLKLTLKRMKKRARMMK